MRVIVLGPHQLRIMLGIFIVLILVLGLLANFDQIARRAMGVRAGVTLEGRSLEGLLPGEVTKIINSMAVRVNRDPRNAYYYPETGEVVPAQAGKNVNVAMNVNQIFQAEAGSNLKLLVSDRPPTLSADYFKPVYYGKKDLPRVALAINVAWGEEYLLEMLKILKAEKVKATFFFVGTWVKGFPELVKSIADEGHEIANHGLYHGHPEQMNQAELEKLILENDALLKSTIGKKPANLFAPPYGELNMKVVSVAGKLGFRTIMWSVDSVDWKNPAPETLLNRVLSKIEPGGIILLHPTIATKESIKTLIHSLRKKGLEPGTVSKIL